MEWAQTIVTAIRSELQSDDLSPLLAEIEEAIRTQDAEKAAAADGPPSMPIAEAPGITSNATLSTAQHPKHVAAAFKMTWISEGRETIHRGLNAGI